MSLRLLIAQSASYAHVAPLSAVRRTYARSSGPTFVRHDRIPPVRNPVGFDVEEHEFNVFGGGVDISRPAPPKNPQTVDGRDAFAVFDAIMTPKMMPGKVSEEMVALGLGTLNNQDNPDLLRRMKRKEEELELQMKAAFQAQGFQYNPRKNRFPSQSRSLDYMNEYWKQYVVSTFRARSDFAKVYERTKHLFVTYNVPPGGEPKDLFTLPERIALKKANKGKIEDALKHLKDIHVKKAPVQADAFNYVLRKWLRANITPKLTFVTELYNEQDKPASELAALETKRQQQIQEGVVEVETRPPFETAIAQLHSLFDDLPVANSATCHLFIEAHLQGGDVTGALAAVQSALDKQTLTYDPVSVYNHILEEVEKYGDDTTRRDQATAVMKHMSKNNVMPDPDTFLSFINATKPAEILAAVREMNFLGIPPTLPIVVALANTLPTLPAVGKRSILEQIITMLKGNPRLLEPLSIGESPEVALIDSLQETAFRIDDKHAISEIHDIVESSKLIMPNLSPSYWDRYVMANSTLFNVAGFTELYNKIKHDFEVSSLFYERFLKACRDEGQAITALRLIGDVRKSYRSKNAQRCYSLVTQSILAAVKKLTTPESSAADRTVALALVEHGVDLLKSINNDDPLPVEAMYESLIEASLELGQFSRALELSRAFEEQATQAKLSRTTLELFVQKCSDAGSFDIATAFLFAQKSRYPGLTESIVQSVNTIFPAPFKNLLKEEFPKLAKADPTTATTTTTVN